MACDKNQTYLQGGESGIGRTEGGWTFPVIESFLTLLWLQISAWTMWNV
jgi:hypothetical protein